MLNFLLNNLNKSGFFVLGVPRRSYNHSITPYLFCNRNGLYVVDVLDFLNNFKKSLFLVQNLFKNRSRFMFLYGSVFLYAAVRLKFKKVYSFFSSKFSLSENMLYKKSSFLFSRKKNLNFLILRSHLLNLFLLNSNFFNDSYSNTFFKFFGENKSIFRFSTRYNRITSVAKLKFFVFSLINFSLRDLKKINANKLDFSFTFNKQFVINKLFFFLNLNKFFNSLLLNFNSKKIIFFEFLNFKDFIIYLKNFRLFFNFFLFKKFSFFYKLKSYYYYFYFKNFYISFFQYDSKKALLNLTRAGKSSMSHFYRKDVNFYYLKLYRFLTSFKIKILKKLILIKKGLGFYKLTSLKKFGNYVRGRKHLRFLLKKNYYYFRLLHKIMAFDRLFNFSSGINQIYSSSNNNELNNFLLNLRARMIYPNAIFWGGSWLGGALSNFFGLKSTMRHYHRDFFRMKRMPDFLFHIQLINSESFISESSTLGIPLFSFSDLNMDSSFFNYFVPANVSNDDLSFFYVHMFLEALVRGYISELNLYKK